MDKRINLLDLFSGIGGFAKGLSDAGFNINNHYFSEIEKHSIANYLYNFPSAKQLGDVRNISKNQINEKIDIITFGSPCQNFSVAGDREGLRGEKSVLIREAMRIVAELQPSIFIWENVKGTFSSNAREDFWAILKAFTDLGSYRLEWQLLNTRWFLPQNRERIYLIGYLAEKCKPCVFPFREDDKLFTRKNEAEKRQSQAKNYSTTVNPKMGSRASDTFIEIGDYRYDDGYRPRAKPCFPTIKNSNGNNIILKIKNATKKGYKEAVEGDSINFSYPSSNSRRGRVGVGVAQTLDTVCNQAVIDDIKLRKLTEIECERLQGFPDNWTEKGLYKNKIKTIAKTNRYRMLGNAVTVDVVREIGKRILIKS